jgi:predicted membrane chloride channel (bestrophin family)
MDCPVGATVKEAVESRDCFLEAEHLARIRSSRNPATVILHVGGELVGKLLREGHLDSIGAVAILRQLEELNNTQVTRTNRTTFDDVTHS